MRNKNVLIAATTRWPIAARLALELIGLDAAVTVLCPLGNPAATLSNDVTRLLYHPLAPRAALARAIVRSDTDLIIPCDDRAVALLHALHATHPEQRAAIERSIGPPTGYKTIDSRAALLSLAAESGSRVPETHAIADLPGLANLTRTMNFPWIMKADGTWSGDGVRRIEDPAAARRFFRWARLGVPVNRGVIAQRPIDGEAANILCVAWRGEIAASVCFAVTRTEHRFGPATVLRIIEHEAMREVARVLARRLTLSGYFGLDFILERSTGAAFLLEMNARTTQLGHLRAGAGRDLPGALMASAFGRTIAPVDRTSGNALVAVFPNSTRSGVEAELLDTAFHDIPTSRPDLVRRLSCPFRMRRGGR